MELCFDDLLEWNTWMWTNRRGKKAGHFLHEIDHFAKTGSGQTLEKHSKRNRVLAEVPLGLMSWGSNPYPYAPDGSPAAVRGSGRGGGDLESGLDNSVLGGAFRFNETGREVQDGYDAGYTGLYLMDCLAQARTHETSQCYQSLVLSHFRWMSTANLPRRSHTDRNHAETLNRD